MNSQKLKLILIAILSVFLSGQNLFSQQGLPPVETDQTEEKSTVVSSPEAKKSETAGNLPQEEGEKSGEAENQEEVPDTSNLVISEFKIEGLKRTKNFYMQRVLKRFKGKKADSETLKEIESTLQKEELFSEIKVSGQPSQTDGEASISIGVKEKITFIPLPFASSSDGGFMAGLFVMDMNALGMHNMAAFGGIYSKNSLLGMATFSKPPIEPGSFGYSISAMSAKNENEKVDIRNETVLKYDSKGFSVSLGLSYKIIEWLSIGINGGYKWTDVNDNDEDGYQEMVKSEKSGSGSANITFSTSDWNGWYISSKKLSLSAGAIRTDNRNNRFAEVASGQLTFQQPFGSESFGRLRFLLDGAGFYGHDLHISNWQGREAAKVSILPSNFSTQKIAGGSAGLELIFAKTKIGSFSVYGLYEAVIAQDWDKDYEFGHGPEGGIKLYLSKIAFPAFAFGLSYNIPKHMSGYSVAFGLAY